MSEPTPEFKIRLKEAFDALQIGRKFTFRRTFTEGDVSIFCGVSGDYNPYHIDDHFARESRFGRRIIPGLLTASMVTHIGGLLGFLASEMTFRYVAPVFVGDTVTCIVTIEEKNETKGSVKATALLNNQSGELVLKAEFKGIPGLVRLSQ